MTNKLLAFYRLYDGSDHFYTTSTAERDNAISTQGYRLEGLVGYVYEKPEPLLDPIYRLYNGSDHFYTNNAAERDNAINTLGYHYEGIACYLQRHMRRNTLETSLEQLYRFYGHNDHFLKIGG